MLKAGFSASVNHVKDETFVDTVEPEASLTLIEN